MSYILEALRKSERERVQNQAPSIGITPVEQPHQKSRWPVWAIPALLIINVLVLFFVLGKPSIKPDSQTLANNNRESEGPSPVNKLPAQEIGARTSENEPYSRPVIPESDTDSVSPPTQIAETTRQNPVLHPKKSKKLSPKPRLKTVDPVKQPTPPLRSASAENQDRFEPPAILEKRLSRIGSQKPTSESRNPQTKRVATKRIADIPNSIPTNNSKPATQVAIKDDTETPENSIPLLREMPPDFQRRVPTLKVNVFAYSDIPQERFAIVNMIKYREGQAPDKGLVIEEIGPDSMVLRYEDKKFRYGGP